MKSLFNYFKAFESKISESELLENQFLDTGIYKVDTFNTNSFSKIVMEKLENSRLLIHRLGEIMESTKTEIVEQINSNVNNYIVLITKLQAIDFLIENIDKPLLNIKNTILNEISFIEKYEADLLKIEDFIKENDNQVKLVMFSLKFYKIYQKCNEFTDSINRRYFLNNLLSHVLNPEAEEDVISHYEVLRSFLADILHFSTRFWSLHQIYVELNSEHVLFSQVEESLNKFLHYVDVIFKIVTIKIYKEDQISNLKDSNESNSEINWILFTNLLDLLVKIYAKSTKKDIVFQKIGENVLNNEISLIFNNKNLQLNKKISLLSSIIDNKYNHLNHLVLSNFIESLEFNVVCYLDPLIKKVLEEKFVFNCIDPSSFKDNYNSFIDFVGRFVNFDNFEKILSKDRMKLINLISKFSFYTYYQFIHSDIVKNLIDDGQVYNQEELYFSKTGTNLSNLLFNFVKMNSEMFRDRKLFLKNLPNYLNILPQCNKYIIAKSVQFFENKFTEKILENLQNKKFDENESKRYMLLITEFLGNFEAYVKFFRDEIFEKLQSLVTREVFIFRKVSELEKLLEKIKQSQILMYNHIRKEIAEKGDIIRLLLSYSDTEKTPIVIKDIISSKL